MKMSFKHFFLFFLLVGIIACSKDPITPDPPVIDSLLKGEITITTNPSGVAPLTARLDFETNEAASVEVKVVGRRGTESDIIKNYPDVNTEFSLIVMGLYASEENEVELKFLDAGGNILSTETITIQTNPLIVEMPRIEVDIASTDQMVPGLTMVNYFGFSNQGFPQRPFMFDAFGDIRWYLDFANHRSLGNLFFDAGMIRLENGNLCFGDISSGAIYEINMLGEIQNQWSLQGNRFHHAVSEKPNGNILATLTDPRLSTVEDLIGEFDRNSDQIVNSWDLTQSLDKTRYALDTDLGDVTVDWIHCNGVVHDPRDNSIIVSGLRQGVIKFSEDNEVVWIIAPHKEWKEAGNGKDLNQYLLQPLDAQGNPIEDQEILSGNKVHPDFEWSWGQHSPHLLENGNIMIFDNGDFRNCEFTGFVNSNAYSRAVEYKVDAENKTIQQVWSYGKERGSETYSRIVSRVNYYKEKDNVIFAPGSLKANNTNLGKVVEVDKSSKQVVFEADIIPPRAFFGITFHSVYRMPLYPD